MTHVTFQENQTVRNIAVRTSSLVQVVAVAAQFLSMVITFPYRKGIYCGQ